MITVDNVYHSQNVSNHNETLTVTCSHSAGRNSSRFQTLTVSIPVSHFFIPVRENATPKRKNFVPFSNSAGHRVNGVGKDCRYAGTSRALNQFQKCYLNVNRMTLLELI